MYSLSGLSLHLHHRISTADFCPCPFQVLIKSMGCNMDFSDAAVIISIYSFTVC